MTKKNVKMSAVIAKRMTALNLTAATEEEARELLVVIIEEHGIEGMETESTETLLDIVESFDEFENPQETKQTTAPTEEEEYDDLAAEEEEYDDLAAEEEEEEEDKPAEKTATKKAASKNKAPAKEEKKAASKIAKTSSKKVGKLNPKKSEEDQKIIVEMLQDVFPTDEFEYAWIANSGVTIKYKGKNSNRGVATIENITKQADGTYTCVVYFSLLNKKQDVLEEAGYDNYFLAWNGVPGIKSVTDEQLIEMFNTLLDSMLEGVRKADDRLGKNREKMEENLKKTSIKAGAKKTVKKQEIEQEEEEEEEEDEKPVVKKSAARKTAKK